MTPPLEKTALVVLAIACCVTTSWSQTPTPTLTPGCADDTWRTTSTANAPSPRGDHTAVWTDSEMIVWGGDNRGTDFSNTGGRYNPGKDTWTATSTTNAPAARAYHTAVWTGSDMIVWGGWNGSFFNTGGRYNPGTDIWTAMNTVNAPTARA